MLVVYALCGERRNPAIYFPFEPIGKDIHEHDQVPVTFPKALALTEQVKEDLSRSAIAARDRVSREKSKPAKFMHYRALDGHTQASGYACLQVNDVSLRQIGAEPVGIGEGAGMGGGSGTGWLPARFRRSHSRSRMCS